MTWPADGVLLREMHEAATPDCSLYSGGDRNRSPRQDPVYRTQRCRQGCGPGRMSWPVCYQGLSVEFKAIRETMRSGVRLIQAAVLTGAGLVDSGAYAAATVEARGKGKRRRLWL